MLTSSEAVLVRESDIRWTLDGVAPWPSSRPLLALVVELLPAIEDDVAANLVEHLALALVDRDDALCAMRVVLSSALALSYTQHLAILRQRESIARLRDELRRYTSRAVSERAA